ncbi:MAG: CBS domain-containing protein [Methanomicrobiales archaeon]|nr:CBS domain-containing protein [Methanomicrobiales archaeon]
MNEAEKVMRDVPLLTPQDHITKARQILRDDIYRELYIHNGERRLLGYIDITDVLRITDTRSNVTVEGFIKRAATVSPGGSLESIAQTLRSGTTDSVAVTDPQQMILGVALLSDIFPTLTTRNEIRGTVGEYMTRNAVTISFDAPLQKVYNLIVESGYTAFPVVRKRTVVGMVSRRDLLRERHVMRSLKNNAKTAVETIMTTPAVTISRDEQLSRAASDLVKHDISRIPVVEDEKIVGIIDRHDVLKALVIP